MASKGIVFEPLWPKVGRDLNHVGLKVGMVFIDMGNWILETRYEFGGQVSLLAEASFPLYSLN